MKTAGASCSGVPAVFHATQAVQAFRLSV